MATELKIWIFYTGSLKLKSTKFDFGWGSTPDPVGGAYSIPLAGFKGPVSKGREGRKDGRRRGVRPKPKNQTSPMEILIVV